ncbi:hypothetical protein DFJ73DRAFT_824676, partial [Zopfochytrium polystomum]
MYRDLFVVVGGQMGVASGDDLASTTGNARLTGPAAAAARKKKLGDKSRAVPSSKGKKTTKKSSKAKGSDRGVTTKRKSKKKAETKPAKTSQSKSATKKARSKPAVKKAESKPTPKLKPSTRGKPVISAAVNKKTAILANLRPAKSASTSSGAEKLAEMTPESFVGAVKSMHSAIGLALRDMVENDAPPHLVARRSNSAPHQGLFTPNELMQDDVFGAEDDLITLDSADVDAVVSAFQTSGDDSGLFFFNSQTSSWVPSVDTLNIGMAPQSFPPPASTTSTRTSPSTKPVVTIAPPTKTAAPTTASKEAPKSGLSPGAIAGIVIGCFAILALIPMLVCLIVPAIRKKRAENADGQPEMTEANSEGRQRGLSFSSTATNNSFKDFLNRFRKKPERRPVLASPTIVQIKKPKWKFWARDPSSSSSVPPSEQSFVVIRNPDRQVYTPDFLPPGYSLAPPPTSGPPPVEPSPWMTDHSRRDQTQ